MSSFYVDNCLVSVQTQSELDRFIDVATEIMAEKKFDDLRGWEYSNPSYPIASPGNVLRMIWDRHCDTISLNIPDLRELMKEVITKRNILAASHKVFDPLGITGTVLLLPKLWLQSLWKSQIGWDEEVDIKTSQDFLKGLKELEYLKHVQVPRWFYTVIVDFSIFRYIFSVTQDCTMWKKGNNNCQTGTSWCCYICSSFSTTVLKEFPTDNVYFWTDSTTVLVWLKRKEPWGAFVYNRVQEIRKLTPVKAWIHVPGSLNPADCPSRGCSAKQLCSSKWWEGPSWLHLSPQEWPISDVEVDVNEVEVNKERRAIVTSMMNVQTTDIKSYEKFKRAEVLVFKSLQSNAFQDERLLAKMQAFKDEDGLLRIRTKLTDSYEKEDFKFPIPLPANDVVVKLIREEHVKAMHAGASILRARIREKFCFRA
ncbi:integrase_H2C2 domain-containing protein [Trichonephila clavipes]|nr:integrase_H2C2 domain-containing protein [Trichonephila clavipes]